MSNLQLITADFETYWDTQHTLSKMSPIEYVMSPKTELISLSFKFGSDKPYCIFGEDRIIDWAAQVDWSDAFLVGHNMSGFDAMIFAWRLGVVPRMWGCTLSMARPIHAKTCGLGLGALVEHYNLGKKDNTILNKTRGRYLRDFTPSEIAAMKSYNIADTNQCYQLFHRLRKHTPTDELRLIDSTIRMLVEPQFVADQAMLRAALVTEKKRKHEMLIDLAEVLGVDTSDEETAKDAVAKTLGSAAKFGDLLESLGVEVPMKVSKTTGKPTRALAKTDEAFLALQQHEDERVAAAAMARLGVKSTLLESRLEAFLVASAAAGGRLPVPLKYYGADTTGRWSGWAYNPQNLPRINPSKPKPSDALRMCLLAPPGHKVIVADLSGIELRVNMFLWKVGYAMELFRSDPANADLYRYFAADQLYNCAEEDIDKEQRQVGKVSHLGLGFGAGAPTFQKVARLMAGINMPLEPVEAPDEFFDDDGNWVISATQYKEWKAAQPLSATEVVKAYRDGHPEIAAKRTGGWARCHQALTHIANGAEWEIDPWGMCVTCADGIRTPVGVIRYPGLRKEEVPVTKPDGSPVLDANGVPETKMEWVYGFGRNKARIYAGKVTENIVQHLARGVIAGYALDFARTKYGRKHLLALTVHDELVYLPKEVYAQQALDTLQGIMRTPPKWWPELVTWSEGDIANSYGEAK